MINLRELKDDARRRRRCRLDLEYWFIRNPNGPPVSTKIFLLSAIVWVLFFFGISASS